MAMMVVKWFVFYQFDLLVV